LPAEVAEERRFFTASDGGRIAITLHFPPGEGPWPLIFEARPYRKDDLSYSSAVYRRYCLEGGYAVCRADVRGTGSSEGVAEDEYTSREWQDWVELFAWIEQQPWSTGSVGMYGTSYSGFNSLQVAALRPPQLKAIIPIYATDRRYTDDVHYGGGVRRGIDFLDYPLIMTAMNALPPVPAVFGEGWREEWLRRIEANEPWELRWLEEQNESDYWRHGSVAFDYGAIEAATMIIAGHADGYHNMAFRTFEALEAPKRLLFGPWSHMSPRISLPGPRIDQVPEMLRWFDRWVKGERNGVDDEPPVAMFVRRSTLPAPDLDSYEGEWRYEPSLPPERLHEEARALSGAHAVGRLQEVATDELKVRGDVGVTGSIWCAADLPFGPPWDQRADEAWSLVYDWEPRAEELEIMGHPRVELTVSSSVPVAFASATLVTRGILNLTHRESHSDPSPLEPGAAYRVVVELDATSWVFEPGHRVRLDIAGADFPSSWPPPLPGTLTVDRAGSKLFLPVLGGPAPVPSQPAFAPGLPRPSIYDEHPVWRIEEDVLERRRGVTIDHGLEEDRDMSVHVVEHYGGTVSVSTTDPGNARATGGTTFELRWPEATVRTESRGTLRSDAATWYLELELDVFENGEPIARRRWERQVPRALQ
jgi:hypothetical protein